MKAVRLLRQRWRQFWCRDMHVWTPDPPGWKCTYCDKPAPPGTGHALGITYDGEGQTE